MRTLWTRHHGDDVSSIQFLLDPFCARQISDKMDEVELVLAFVWVHQYADVPEITKKGDGIVMTMTNRTFILFYFRSKCRKKTKKQASS